MTSLERGNPGFCDDIAQAFIAKNEMIICRAGQKKCSTLVDEINPYLTNSSGNSLELPHT